VAGGLGAPGRVRVGGAVAWAGAGGSEVGDGAEAPDLEEEEEDEGCEEGEGGAGGAGVGGVVVGGAAVGGEGPAFFFGAWGGEGGVFEGVVLGGGGGGYGVIGALCTGRGRGGGLGRGSAVVVEFYFVQWFVSTPGFGGGAYGHFNIVRLIKV